MKLAFVEKGQQERDMDASVHAGQKLSSMQGHTAI